MQCKKFELQACDYIDGELSEKEKKQFEYHLELCQHCREYLDEMKKTVKMLHTVKPIDLPPSFHGRLIKSLEEYDAVKDKTEIIPLSRKQNDVKRPVLRRVFQTAVTFAACVLIVVGVVTGGQQFFKMKSENSTEQDLFALDMGSEDMKIAEGKGGDVSPEDSPQLTVAMMETISETTGGRFLMQMAGRVPTYKQTEYKINLITENPKKTEETIRSIALNYEADFETLETKKSTLEDVIVKISIPAYQYDAFSNELLTLKKEGLIEGYIESELNVIDYGFEVEQINNRINEFNQQIESLKENQSDNTALIEEKQKELDKLSERLIKLEEEVQYTNITIEISE